MKLAICSVGELFGGVERHILGMSTWLKREGHEFVLVLFHDRELARQAREIGVEPVILEGRGSFDPGVVKRLGAVLEEHEVDVVHAHGYKAVVNCALARRKYKFAMVRTVHGLVEPGQAFSVGYLKAILFVALEKWAGKMTKAHEVCVTDDLRRQRANPGNRFKCTTIHNGIDPIDRKELKRPRELDSGEFHLAIVGRVSKVKGVEFALDAMSQLGRDRNVVLNIIGTGPLVEPLKKRSIELGLHDRVRFLGFCHNIYDYLAHIDVLLMPSFHEGLPFTLLEAMSLKKPIIASSVGGIPEALEQGVSGMLVSVGDVSGLVSAINELASNPNLALSIGQAGQDRQLEEFNLEIMGSSYFKEYLELSENGR